MPSIIMTSTCNLCCIIVGPSYRMTAQHKSNIGCVSFTCVVVGLLLCNVMLTTTLCLMLGQHLILWINMNPALGHCSYWCAVSVSMTIVCDAVPTLRKHWTSVYLSCLRCKIDKAGLMYVNCLRRWPNIKSTLIMCIFPYIMKLY